MEALRSHFQTTPPGLIYITGGLVVALVAMILRWSMVYSQVRMHIYAGSPSRATIPSQSNIPFIGERWKTWFPVASVMGAKEHLEEGNRKVKLPIEYQSFLIYAQ